MVQLRPAVPPDGGGPRHLKDALRRWSPTRAFGRVVLIVGIMLGSAMLRGRADLVVLAAPFALGAALGIWRRPTRVPQVAVTMGAEFTGEGGRVPAGLSVGNPGEVPYDLVILRTAISPWLVVPHGDRPYVTTVPPGTAADLELAVRAVRWGRPALGPAVAHAVAADGRPVWSGCTTRAGRARVGSWPGYAGSRPATGCAASTGVPRCGPGSCTWPPRCPTATPRSSWCSTCCTRRAGPAGSAAPGRCWTPRSARRPGSPSTTCTAVTGWRCWSTASGRAGCGRPAGAASTTPCWSGCSASTRRPAGSNPPRTRSARTPSRPTPSSWCSPRCWTCGRRRWWPGSRGPAGSWSGWTPSPPTCRCPGRSTATGPRRPAGCGRWSAPTRWDSCASTGYRSSPGPARAAWTRCCGRCRGWPRRPRRSGDDRRAVRDRPGGPGAGPRRRVGPTDPADHPRPAAGAGRAVRRRAARAGPGMAVGGRPERDVPGVLGRGGADRAVPAQPDADPVPPARLRRLAGLGADARPYPELRRAGAARQCPLPDAQPGRARRGAALRRGGRPRRAAALARARRGGPRPHRGTGAVRRGDPAVPRRAHLPRGVPARSGGDDAHRRLPGPAGPAPLTVSPLTARRPARAFLRRVIDDGTRDSSADPRRRRRARRAVRGPAPVQEAEDQEGRGRGHRGGSPPAHDLPAVPARGLGRQHLTPPFGGTAAPRAAPLPPPRRRGDPRRARPPDRDRPADHRPGPRGRVRPDRPGARQRLAHPADPRPARAGDRVQEHR